MENFNRFKPVFARFPFTFNGEQYEPGDLFEAAPHIVQRMWFARRLTHGAEVKTQTDEVTAVTLDHKGAGWYDVLMHGAVMNPEKIKGKQKAIEWAVETLGVTENDIGA